MLNLKLCTNSCVVAGEMRLTRVLLYREGCPGGGNSLKWYLNRIWKYKGFVVDTKTMMPDVLKAKGQTPQRDSAFVHIEHRVCDNIRAVVISSGVCCELYHVFICYTAHSGTDSA